IRVRAAARSASGDCACKGSTKQQTNISKCMQRIDQLLTGRDVALLRLYVYGPPFVTFSPVPSFKVETLSTGRFLKRSTSPLGQRTSTEGASVLDPSPKCRR